MEITGISSISVHNKKFYAGQTKEEAINRGIYERTWRRDFTNIDTNDDGVLSVNEILKERKRVNKEDKTEIALGTALIAIPDMLVHGISAAALWVPVTLGLILYNANYSRNNKKICNYIQENNIDVNKPNNLSVKG